MSALDDKTRSPGPDDLAEVLGRSNLHWNRLLAHLRTDYPPLTEKWGFAGAKWGWSLRVIQKKRTILYLTPQTKRFLVGFVLGE